MNSKAKVVGYNCPVQCKNKKTYPANTESHYCHLCGHYLAPIKEYLLPVVKKINRSDEQCQE